MSLTLWPGHPHPLRCYVGRQGTKFALFSENATSVELCLFDAEGLKRVCLWPKSAIMSGMDTLTRHWPWPHAMASGSMAPHEPDKGKRFNPNKLLLDPLRAGDRG
jgi:isoamylase